MAAMLPHRPGTNGTTSSNGSNTHRTSLSSFPTSSRSTSQMSQRHMQQPLQSSAPHVHDTNRTSDGSSKTPSSGLSSQHSSISMAAYKPPARGRRLRSQYPRGSSENHVEYILVASFHVDRGPIMEHQYPGAISGDEHMLAELMLPDQAHVLRRHPDRRRARDDPGR